MSSVRRVVGASNISSSPSFLLPQAEFSRVILKNFSHHPLLVEKALSVWERARSARFDCDLPKIQNGNSSCRCERDPNCETCTTCPTPLCGLVHRGVGWVNRGKASGFSLLMAFKIFLEGRRTSGATGLIALEVPFYCFQIVSIYPLIHQKNP
jgi:hypothetical protein